MQLGIRSDGYLEYLRQVHHSSGDQEIKDMLYDALSEFEQEYREQGLIVPTTNQQPCVLNPQDQEDG